MIEETKNTVVDVYGCTGKLNLVGHDVELLHSEGLGERSI